MSEDIASLEKWKEKKLKKKDRGSKKNKFVKQRKWMSEDQQIKELEAKYAEFDVTKVETFEEYPLSNNTKMGLAKAEYTKPTAIQQASFMPAIQGRDILGAAKTGSGKTLAFLIPVLECLYRQRWTSIAGPGALIISPTRELAYQTFEVLKKIGQFHDFSAGLIIGGKDVKSEATRMSRTNILICTPGRLLQHMDQTVNFDASSLQILVLDEADRILDMGFKATLNAVLENLPNEKQTLLFSATQTKSVKDLARLSLSDPAYVAVHEKSKSSTPAGLNQNYIICNLEDKLNILYSFVKTHLKTKTLVFSMSCKQVQFIYAAFCKLRPGVPTLMLHGKMNQMRRMSVYEEFCRKKFALLFCTDIAARGLDFPAVDWVVQLDCPEDAETYIHRAGRTARYHGEGHALLLLLESEKEAMLQQLKDRKVPISKTEINTEKITNISPRLESFCAADLELKQKAQREKQKNIAENAADKESVDANVEEADAESFNAVLDSTNEVGDMFSIKRKNVFELEQDVSEKQTESEEKVLNEKALTKVGAIKKQLKKKYKYNQKIVFDEEGDLQEAWPPVDPKAYEQGMEQSEGNGTGLDIEKAKQEMRERDITDRQQHKMKIKQKHRESRWKEKEERRKQQAVKEGRSYKKEDEETVAFLDRPEEEGDLSSDDASGDMPSGGEDVTDENLYRKRAFDDSDNDSHVDERIPKRKRVSKNETLSDLMTDAGFSLEDDEKLALHLLGR